MTAAVVRQAVPLGTQAKPGPQWLQQIDVPFLLSGMAIIAIGLVMVASASVGIAAKTTGVPLAIFWRQLAHSAAAVLVCAALWPVTLDVWRRIGGIVMVIAIVALVAVLIPGVGREVNGATRWLPLGVANLQPSEFVKIFVVVYLAGYLVRRAKEVRSAFSGFVKPVGILILIALLLLLEPDFGATVVVFATALAMLFLGGAPLKIFFGWMVFAFAALAAILMAAPYRMERLLTFMDPWEHPFDGGFQLAQALIAIGRGDWLGVGLGSSVQKLFYLPEAHTDFLFAVLGEELGLVGMTLVLILFTVMVWRGFVIAREAQAQGDDFGAYLAQGLTVLIGLQAIFNVGVNMGVLPTKGLTLPLMSYGGSSLVASMLAATLILRVGRETRGARLS
ncbi:MAG: putative lipid II flippase FtsW [Chromatiales bacterium]|jgi:cell division protein FtsW|nr:putative lipid II flippase FtsW [Chromatiales bacterium]